VALAVGLAVLAGALVLWPRPDRITRENFDRIRKGMSRAEVEAILGPPGDYRTILTEGANRVYFKNRPMASYEKVWKGNAGNVVVLIGFDGVCYKAFLPTVAVEQAPLEYMRWRAERQLQRWFPEEP
jgi:hypothetical protein